MSKTLILFCGGTISMHKNNETGALDVSHNADQLFELAPRAKEICDIDVQFVDNIDSSNMVHTHWERISTIISEHYNDYDGFVITMGTNTMAYCSAALSFALHGIGKPVILTGAQIPAEAISTDARNNFVNALRLSTMDLSGVYVVFGSKIIRGCRAKKVSESELDAFKTFNQKDFGEIGVGTLFNFRQPRHSNAFTPRCTFDDRVICLTSIPGLQSDIITHLIDMDMKGIIIRAYGSGDIPYSFLPSLNYAKEKHIPVLITTQCPGGATVMGVNDVGLKALDAGAIQAFDMCMEAMSTKLMWLLGQKAPYSDIKRLMEQNMVGEVDFSRAAMIMGL
jgi:L-asparaginase